MGAPALPRASRLTAVTMTDLSGTTVRSRRRRTGLAVLTAVLALAALSTGAAPRTAPSRPSPDPAPAGSPAGWLEIDYGPLVDTRRLTHSGESIGMVLKDLDG